MGQLTPTYSMCIPLLSQGQSDLPTSGEILHQEDVFSLKKCLKGATSTRKVPPLSVTHRCIALKDISSDNHYDNMDHPMDTVLDMVSCSALVAPASGVRGSKVEVSSMASPTII